MPIKVLGETKEIIDFNKTGVHEKDSKSLCAAKHEVAIGITKMSDRAQPIPFEDYIIVHFRPYDTSGGGEAMLVIAEAGKGVGLFFTDGDAYNDAMAAGREGAQNKYNNCVAEKGRAACTGVLIETGAFTGLSAVGSGAGYVASGVVNTAKDVLCGWANPLCAETDYNLYAEQDTRRLEAESPFYAPLGIENRNFLADEHEFGELDFCKNPDDPRCGDAWGEEYHGVQGDTHKIRITITNTYEGKTVTRYRYDLSGCGATYDESLGWCYNGESYKRFLITNPGEWTVNVKPIATASCEALDYTETATFTVETPEGWDEEAAITTLSTDISVALQDAGVPVFVSPLMLVGGASLIGGLLVFKIYKKKKAKAE